MLQAQAAHPDSHRFLEPAARLQVAAPTHRLRLHLQVVAAVVAQAEPRLPYRLQPQAVAMVMVAAVVVARPVPQLRPVPLGMVEAAVAAVVASPVRLF